MCVVQVGTLVLQRSHKYFELEIKQTKSNPCNPQVLEPTKPDPTKNEANSADMQ